jgi:hypothetical protein
VKGTPALTTKAGLRQAANSYAAELNLLDRQAIPEWRSEIAAESPYWDDRTNLLSLTGDQPEDAALVLATRPGGDDYVVIRWAGRWIVDTDPVDWEAVRADVAADE